MATAIEGVSTERYQVGGPCDAAGISLGVPMKQGDLSRSRREKQGYHDKGCLFTGLWNRGEHLNPLVCLIRTKSKLGNNEDQPNRTIKAANLYKTNANLKRYL